MDDTHRLNAWKVVFVLLNLAALGLATWTIDSATVWGYTLRGQDLVVATGLAAVLVMFAVLGERLFGGDRTPVDEDEPEVDTDPGSGEDGGDNGNTGDESATGSTTDDGLIDSGQPLDGKSGSSQPDDSAHTGTFAAERWGDSSTDTSRDSQGNPQAAAREPNRAADTAGQPSEPTTRHPGDNSSKQVRTDDWSAVDEVSQHSVTAAPAEADPEPEDAGDDTDNATDGPIDPSVLTDTVKPEDDTGDDAESDADDVEDNSLDKESQPPASTAPDNPDPETDDETADTVSDSDGTTDDTIDRSILTDTANLDDDGVDDAVNDGDDVEDDGLNEATVRYHHERSPY